MRFDDRLTFIKAEESRYDPVQGGYIDGEEVEDTVPCNLSSLGTERTNELFGQIDKKILVARLQQPYKKPFDSIKIDDKTYQMKRRSDYRKGVFFLEG